MSSSTAESEDESICRLREAADTSFISDALFKAPNASGTDQVTKETTQTLANKLTLPKSQRYLEFADDETDLKIPKSLQDLIYKKMSTNIESSVEFVDIPVKKKTAKQTGSGGVKLLSDTEPITHIGPIEIGEDRLNNCPVKHSKPKIQRRQIEPDAQTKEEKLRMVVIDGNTILQKAEIQHWKQRKIISNKMFNYREKNSVLYLVEPTNEFSALRKKNNWSENKIAKMKRKK